MLEPVYIRSIMLGHPASQAYVCVSYMCMHVYCMYVCVLYVLYVSVYCMYVCVYCMYACVCCMCMCVYVYHVLNECVGSPWLSVTTCGPSRW